MSAGDILAAAGAAFGVLGAIIAALLKYAIDKRDKEIDRRFDDGDKRLAKAVEDAKKVDDEATKEVEAQVTKTNTELQTLTRKHGEEARDAERKMHAAELAHVKLEGRVDLLAKTHENIERDLDEIKTGMVSRKEWEERMDRVDETMSKLDVKLDNYARVQRWSPPAGIPAVRPPQSPLPREEDDLRTYKPPRGPTR